MGGAERQDVPMTQSLNAVSTLAQDHRNIETHPNTVCVLHSVTQHSVNTNTRSQRVIYQHIETQYHRVCTTQSQHEDNTTHNKTFSPKKAPSQILSKSFFDLLLSTEKGFKLCVSSSGNCQVEMLQMSLVLPDRLR